MKIALLLALLVSGCAKVYAPVPYGKDTYVINAENMSGIRSQNYLQVKAAQRANAFCEKQGKVMQVQGASGAGAHMWSGTSSNLVFSCAEK